jgi:hypothetical protein
MALSSAHVHSEEFEECVAIMAQYIYDRFGKSPSMVPSIFVLTYLQAHHLDLEFYYHHFGPGAYLQTHADHTARWHRESDGGKKAEFNRTQRGQVSDRASGFKKLCLREFSPKV